MSELNSQSILPVLEKTKSVYRTWQQISDGFPKPFRFGLGARIENLFIDILELQFLAMFSNGFEKIDLVSKSIVKFDLLKFLMQISWENKHLKEKTYIPIGKELEQIGRDLGNWKKFLENKTPANNNHI